MSPIAGNLLKIKYWTISTCETIPLPGRDGARATYTDMAGGRWEQERLGHVVRPVEACLPDTLCDGGQRLQRQRNGLQICPAYCFIAE